MRLGRTNVARHRRSESVHRLPAMSETVRRMQAMFERCLGLKSNACKHRCIIYSRMYKMISQIGFELNQGPIGITI